MSKKRKKHIREDVFLKDRKNHFIRMQRTGNEFPQPARIIISYTFYCDVGGWKGYESKVMYDRTFKDWDYAHAVYDEILRRANRKHDHKRNV